MRQLITILTVGMLFTGATYGQTGPVGHFHKIIVSPYIQVTFVQGDEESVTINQSIIDSNKLNVEVHGGTLRLYLDALSLRGEESFLVRSPLSVKKFHLHVYGESAVTLTEVHIAKMRSTIYGESSVDIKAGAINQQYFTCYGEGKIDATAITGQEARVTAFGEAEFRVNVSDLIKITAFGDAKICYRGNPEIVKGIHLGGVDVQKLD
jgi:hypothetical protein